MVWNSEWKKNTPHERILERNYSNVKDFYFIAFSSTSNLS